MDDRLNKLESRVVELERIATQMNDRLTRLEPRHIPAPPVQTPPNPYASVPKWAVDGATPPIPIAEVHRPTPDAEYQLGAQWLPRIGAALLILGIAFLIGLGVTKGWITPVMLFAGAVVLCLSFVVGGFLLRDEREDFGQVLMGIGSCGMFATLAGGHVYQNLYSGEVLVGAFVLWSLANLAYASWRSSRAFLAIGVMGGFIGAAMPVSKQAFELSLILNAVVLMVSAAVVVRHRFSAAAIGVWMASGLAMMPAVFEDSLPWGLRVAAIYTSTLICILAYLLGRNSESKSQETQLIAVLMTATASLLAYEIAGGVAGTLHVLLAAIACGAISFAFRRDHPVRDVFAWLGLSLACLLAPWGLQLGPAVVLMGALALATATTSALMKRPEWTGFSILQITVAGCAYMVAMFENRFPTRGLELAAVGTILAASWAVAWAIGKREDDPKLMAVFAFVWSAVSRFGLLIAQPTDLKLANFGLTASWVVLGSALLMTGFMTALKNYRYAGIGVLLCAAGKVLLIDLATATPELRVAVLIAVGLALLAGGYAYIRRRTDRFA